MLDKFQAFFEPRLGTFNKGVAKHSLKSVNIVPKFCWARPLPLALRDKAKEELNCLLKLKVISDWATPVAPAVKPTKHRLPGANDLVSKLVGGNEFSKIDLPKAYQQFLLNGESQYATVSTHKGLFRHHIFRCSFKPSDFSKNDGDFVTRSRGRCMFLRRYFNNR